MPDLLKLQYLAKVQSETYKSDVLAQKKAFEARLELFKLAPQQVDDELKSLISFMAQMSKVYKELDEIPRLLLQLIVDEAPNISQEFRFDLFKSISMLVNAGKIKITEATLSQFFTLLALHDKPLRASVQTLLMKNLPLYLADNKLLNPFQQYLQNPNCSLLLQQKLLEIMHKLFYEQKLKSDNQKKRVVNIFVDVLIKSADTRIINTCLNFLLDPENDQNDDVEDEDLEQMDIAYDNTIDPLKKDDLNKLYGELKQAIGSFKIDEVRRRRVVGRIQAKIRRLKFKKDTVQQSQLLVLDYIRSPQTVVEQVISKFLNKNCKFYLRLRVFDFIAKMCDLFQLLTPNVFTHYSKYMRPTQENVTDLMEMMIQSVNANQQSDEIRQCINQIVLNFVHSGASDDEIVVGINCITEMCKKLPNILLEDEDGISLLNELMSYSSNKVVLHSHDGKKSCKTSSSTRKGVVMASRSLVNFYRKVAPGYLQKKYLDRDSSMLLQNLQKLNKNTKFINDGSVKPIKRIQGIEVLNSENSTEEIEENEEDEKVSKHQMLKAKELRSHYMNLLKKVRSKSRELSQQDIEGIQQYLGISVDINGNEIENSEYEEVYEEEAEIEDNWANDSEFEDVQVTEQQQQVKIDPKNYQEEESEDEKNITNIPIEQQRILTQEELMKIRRNRYVETNEVDLQRYTHPAKMTIEEKRIHTRESKDPEGHKSHYWNRKDITRKSRTNKEKQSDKAMAMIVHSQVVRRKMSRSRVEKEQTRKKHAYNMKRGISKKTKM